MRDFTKHCYNKDMTNLLTRPAKEQTQKQRGQHYLFCRRVAVRMQDVHNKNTTLARDSEQNNNYTNKMILKV